VTRRGGSRRSGALVALLLGLVLTVPAAARATGLATGLVIGSDGTVSIAVTVVDPNGSALRYAMDGNFSPIVDGLTTNTTQRTTILAEITTAERTPILDSFFGNRDGSVTDAEAALFSSLVRQELSAIPVSSLSGSSSVAFRLDGAAPTSVVLSSLTFLNASGPDASPAPITIQTTGVDTFPYGSGAHQLQLTLNTTPTNVNVSLLTGDVAVTITTPAATTITSTHGFASASVTNDPWGWGAASLHGTVAPASNAQVGVNFGPSFPTGDVVIAAVVGAALASAVVLLWRRARRRRATAAEAPP
jgi:hypothetical protein